MKKLVAWLAISLFAFSSCETIPAHNRVKMRVKARVTFYSNTTCPYGSKVACSSKFRAQEGITVAAPKRFLHFGTQLWIHNLKGVFCHSRPFIVQDRGSDVEKLKASRGSAPVIDVFVHTDSHKEGIKREHYLASINPDYLDIDILQPE